MYKIEDVLATLLNVQNSFMEETSLGFQNKNAIIKGHDIEIRQLENQLN